MPKNFQKRFDGKTAIITGGAAGIGWATALNLANSGADVAICSRPGTTLDAATDKIAKTGLSNIQCYSADVSNKDDVGKMMNGIDEKFGKLDYVVNNAGIDGFVDWNNFSTEEWHRTMNVNLLAVFLVIEASLPLMQKTAAGSIVNVSSIHAHLTVSGRAAYTASKAALSGATRAMAIDMGKHGIRVNTVSPGVVYTAMLERSMAANSPDIKAETIIERLSQMHPVGRIGRPDDIAKTIAFLLSDDAAFVTGVDLIADGGMHTRLSNAFAWGT